VRSANETAYVIAENLCSSREEFYRLMNEKARELGATNTNFVNPAVLTMEKREKIILPRQEISPK